MRVNSDPILSVRSRALGLEARGDVSLRIKQIAPIKTMAIMPGKEQQEACFS